MASDPDKIGHSYGDQRRQKSAEDEHHRKVDQRYSTADGAKTNKLENFLLSHHGSKTAKLCTRTRKPGFAIVGCGLIGRRAERVNLCRPAGFACWKQVIGSRWWKEIKRRIEGGLILPGEAVRWQT